MTWLYSINWRRVMAIAPLPALGLAASYGVFRFALMFVPSWVAFVQAASFELTYIGLAVVDGLTPEQRKRAQYIGMGAVVVSVLYNSLDGFFHLRPSALEAPPVGLHVALAILHGLPLAVVAYLVSNLLLHAPAASALAPSQNATESPESAEGAIVGGRPAQYTLEDVKRAVAGREHIKRAELVELLGCSAATASRLISDASDAGLLSKNGNGYHVLS